MPIKERMLVLASSYSAGYRVGQVLAVVVLAALAIWLTLRARRQQTRRARITDALVALLCTLLLVGAVARLVDHQSSDGWDSQQGRELRAGFLAGCEDSSSPEVLDCECVFEQLTSAPPGDTPAGFAQLGPAMAGLANPGPGTEVPPQIYAALMSCRVAS